MSAIEPRDYQEQAVDAIFKYFQEYKGNPIVAMPTGTGKSVVIAIFLWRVFQMFLNQRVLMLTHVKELVGQNHAKLLDVWPTAPVGVYSAGLKKRELNCPITFAGIASIAKRAKELGHIDLVVVDECHLVSQNEGTLYRLLFEELAKVNPYVKVIGFSATAWREGEGRMDDGDGLFTDTCFDITDMLSFNRLIDEGYLSPVVPRRTVSELDVDGVHMRGGDFIPSELQCAVDKDEVTRAALLEALELIHDRHHILVFATGINHSCNIADMLGHFGESAIAIHSKMDSDKERDEGIAGFKSGKYRFCVNNGVLTTGFDFPGIDCIIMLRPTGSSKLWVQMLGRGTRPLYEPGYDLKTTEGRLAAIAAGPKQDCLVLDFAGNTKRLGPINDPVLPKKKGQKGGTAPVKLCGACNTYNHASVPFCTFCGHKFEFLVKIEQTASTNVLIKTNFKAPIIEVFKVDHITYSIIRKAGKPPIFKVTYYSSLRHFSEILCPEHNAGAYRMTEKWWAVRSQESMPSTVDAIMEEAHTLFPATHIRVQVNLKYPEVTEHDFSGTGFGAVQVVAELPSVSKVNPISKSYEEAKTEALRELSKDMEHGADDIF